MTKDDVIRMAKDAGWQNSGLLQADLPGLTKFADLVSAHEREGCAKVCRDKAGTDGYDSSTAVYLYEDIQARGKQ